MYVCKGQGEIISLTYSQWFRKKQMYVCVVFYT